MCLLMDRSENITGGRLLGSAQILPFIGEGGRGANQIFRRGVISPNTNDPKTIMAQIIPKNTYRRMVEKRM